MKKPKLIALITAASVAFAAVPYISPLPVLAAETSTAESEALKKAITEVKGRLNVPDELSEFRYETTEKYKTVFYKFYWFSEGKTNRYIAGEYEKIDKLLTVEYFDGQITSYTYSDPDFQYYGKKGFAKLSLGEQESYAKKYFKQLNPNLKGNTEFSRNTSETSLDSQVVSYKIARKEYGVYMDNNSGSISIDRDTGKLINFRLSWYNDAVPADASKAISVEKANSLYKERKGLKDAYYQYFTNSVYNEKTEEWETERFVLPVYVPENSGENEIDALTGKYTAFYEDRKKYSYTSSYDWGVNDEVELFEEAEEEYFDDDVSSGAAAFTEEELKAIDKESNYISKEKAIQIIKDDKYITYNKELIFTDRNVNTAYDDDGEPYSQLSMAFKYSSEKGDDISLRVYMNAHSGDIISFSKYYGQYASKYKSTVNVTSARSTAEAAMKHFMSERSGEYKLTDTSDGITDYMNNQKKVYSKSFTFTRYVNGLAAPFDTVRVEVDADGEVLNYRYTYHSIKFPKPQLVSKDKCYENLFKNMKPELKYTGFRDLQMKSHTYLTYVYDSSFTINALTGERINYNGKPYYTNDNNPTTAGEIRYTDIKGHKYEKEINTLLDYGVYVTDSDKLNPDSDITVGEFLKLMNRAYGLYDPYGFRTEAERESYGKKKLTHAELAKIYMLSYSGNSRQDAEYKGIYKKPFDDVEENNAYCGYIALAKAKGYIHGKNGKFNPNKGITKAECLKLTYDYFCTDSEKTLYEIFVI